MAKVFLVGARGIPNRYGGFERLVEVLAPYLVTCGHDVTVFCEGTSEQGWHSDTWQGVHRRFVPVTATGARGTLQYDWRSFSEVPRGSVALIFGYGTALFQMRLRARGVPHVVNMDGIEWQREKWSTNARRWLRFNERIAVRLSDVLIADHPEIQRYLSESLGASSEMIAYGVDRPGAAASPRPEHPVLARQAGRPYFLVIARPEPENQVRLLMEAYRRSGSDADMLVVGNFGANAYGRGLQRDFPEAQFTGAVYDLPVLDVLRREARLYLHGHSVGGTNPSLIEAMAAGALVAAHDNPFNRWVLGEGGGLFFKTADDLAALMAVPLASEQRAQVIQVATRTCEERYLWPHILGAYEAIVDRLVAQLRP